MQALNEPREQRDPRKAIHVYQECALCEEGSRRWGHRLAIRMSSPSNMVGLTWTWTRTISWMPTTTLTILLICETLKLLLMMILLICETLRLLTLTRKQQRIPRARQQGREVQEGHAECCQPQARPQVLRVPEVQGVLEAPEVLDGLVRRCDHPARIHQPDPETRRHQGCLAGLSGQAGLQDRIGHRGRGLQEHREGLDWSNVSGE